MTRRSPSPGRQALHLALGGLLATFGAAALDAAPASAALPPAEALPSLAAPPAPWTELSPFSAGAEIPAPGLVGPDGEPRSIAEPPAPRRRLDVTAFGAVADDAGFDNTPAFGRALEAAGEGDEIYVPEGRFHFRSYLPSASFAHLTLAKDGLCLRGAGREKTVLVSDALDLFDKFPTKPTTVVLVSGAKGVRVSDLALSSTASLDYDWRLTGNNPRRDGPKYGLRVGASAAGRATVGFLAENLLIERFQRMGLRLESSREALVRGCLFRDATDLGGGGAGYGVAIQGKEGRELRGTALDSARNAVLDCEFRGPRLRHAVLLQYLTHNNLVAGNRVVGTQLGAIDLHGEGEYLNEIAYNSIEGVYRGGGIELGNTGAGHAASGRGNFLHHNLVLSSRHGIIADLGSAETRIEDNRVEGCLGAKPAYGIAAIDADRSLLLRNTVRGFRAGGGGAGIFVGYRFYPDAPPEGGLTEGARIEGNRIEDCDLAILVEAGRANLVAGNAFSGNGADLVDRSADFRYPDDSRPAVDLAGAASFQPSADSYVSTEDRRADFSADTRLKVKCDRSDPAKNRIAYLAFDLDEDPRRFASAWLRLAGKIGSTASRVDLAIYLLPDFEDWREGSLSWEDSPGHDPGLSRAAGGRLLGRLSMSVTGAERVYYAELPGLPALLSDGRFSLMIVNETEDPDGEEYVDIYSRERGRAEHRPALFLK